MEEVVLKFKKEEFELFRLASSVLEMEVSDLIVNSLRQPSVTDLLKLIVANRDSITEFKKICLKNNAS